MTLYPKYNQHVQWLIAQLIEGRDESDMPASEWCDYILSEFKDRDVMNKWEECKHRVVPTGEVMTVPGGTIIYRCELCDKVFREE